MDGVPVRQRHRGKGSSGVQAAQGVPDIAQREPQRGFVGAGIVAVRAGGLEGETVALPRLLRCQDVLAHRFSEDGEVVAGVCDAEVNGVRQEVIGGLSRYTPRELWCEVLCGRIRFGCSRGPGPGHHADAVTAHLKQTAGRVTPQLAQAIAIGTHQRVTIQNALSEAQIWQRWHYLGHASQAKARHRHTVRHVTRSPILLAALADAAVPQIAPIKVEGLAVPAGALYQTAHVTGHDGRVWVVRSALTGAAGAELAASDALVQLLHSRVPFDAPRVAGVARPKEGPAVAVYEQLRGNALDWHEFRGRTDSARAVGEALAALHDVDPRVVEEAGLPSYDAATYRQRLLSDLDRAAGTGLVPSSLLARWEAALQADELWRFSTTVTHGPLRGEDVRVDEGVVSGISGWEHAGVADPARDFALLWRDAPQQAFDTVFEAYATTRTDRPDRHLERRIRLMAELELAYSLLQSRTMGETRLVEFHQAALRSLALDVEDDTSLMPPPRKVGTPAMSIDPDEVEAIGTGDLEAENEMTVEIPVRPNDSGTPAANPDAAGADGPRRKLPSGHEGAGSHQVTPPSDESGSHRVD